MADFKQALDWLNEGKKIRIIDWYLGGYFTFNKEKNEIIDEVENVCELNASHILDKSWELYQEKPKHFCKAVNHPNANIRCVSLIDSNKWLCLFWIDESSLLVEYCPFCGKKADQ
jgi:hypothetical protein